MSGTTIVYGATGGIGEAVARQLHSNGIGLHLVARDPKRLAELAGVLDAGSTSGDVTDPELFARVAAAAGDVVDGLVYAVGTINLKSVTRLNTTDFETDFRVNALGAALAVQSIVPALKRSDSASVVLYSSIAATQGFANHGSVGMAKGAVNGLTLSLAAELAPRVRVNALAPSLTRTPLAGAMLANERLAQSLAALHPLQRLGSPEDIAQATVFLLSGQSSWMTGQIVGVDGGRSTLRTNG